MIKAVAKSEVQDILVLGLIICAGETEDELAKHFEGLIDPRKTKVVDLR